MTKRRSGRDLSRTVVMGLALAAAGCAARPAPMVLEVQGAVLYRKPAIAAVTTTVADTRATGGAFAVTIAMTGDPGLEASFDIEPGIVTGRAMSEETAGRYVGQFAFPKDLTGGPYAVVVRLKHAKAGESSLRDPRPLSIPLVR